MYNSVEGSENSSKSRMTQLKPVKDWTEKLVVQIASCDKADKVVRGVRYTLAFDVYERSLSGIFL